MKKRYALISSITVLFLLIMAVSPSVAQSVKTGAKAGINFTNLNGGNTNYESRTGYMIGGFVKMNIPESTVAIQPEIYFAQKGAETSDGGEITLEYLEIPILVKIGLSKSEVVKPNIFAGPYAGINLKQQSGSLFGGADREPENIDFGGVIGAGLDIEAGSSIFTIDLRYGFGLSPVFKNGDEKNGLFAIVAGISLPSKD